MMNADVLGPYVKDWFERDGKGILPWHPSRLGHELRAAHYAYFWTLIFKDALDSMLGQPLDTFPLYAL